MTLPDPSHFAMFEIRGYVKTHLANAYATSDRTHWQAILEICERAIAADKAAAAERLS